MRGRESSTPAAMFAMRPCPSLISASRVHGTMVLRLRAMLLLGLLVAMMAWPASTVAEDAPPPPLAPALDRLFPDLQERTDRWPAFFRDGDLTLHLRTYYLNRRQPNGTENEALAFGGRFGYRSGWLLDTFAVGATFYGSAPLYAPDDRDGTLLLKPGQEGYYVPGEAWAALRYKEYARLTGYRQQVDQTYINPFDSRMTPNTFEAVTLGGKAEFVEYLVGYLWNVKLRDSDTFVSMSSAAGVKGRHDGVAWPACGSGRCRVSSSRSATSTGSTCSTRSMRRSITGTG